MSVPDRHAHPPDDADVKALVRAFEVGIGDRSATATRLSAREANADVARILVRIRGDRVPEPAPRRRLYDLGVLARGISVIVMIAVLVVLYFHPSALAPALVLFVVGPVVLVMKWLAEAYQGPELNRHGAQLDQYATQFRRRRAVLDRWLAELAPTEPVSPGCGPAGTRGAALLEKLAALRGAVDDMVVRLAAGSRGSRQFAANWEIDAAEACRRSAPAIARIEPGPVGDALERLIADITDVFPLVGGPASGVLPDASDRSTRPAPGWQAALISDLTDLRRGIRISQRPIVKQCDRLYGAFDAVHRPASRQAIRQGSSAPRWRAVTLARLTGTNLSTLSPVTRTQRRTQVLRSADILPMPATATVGPATTRRRGGRGDDGRDEVVR